MVSEVVQGISVSRSVVSDSLRPHGLQLTRLLCPWDFPGKDTGVGCHFFSRESSQPRDQTQVSCTAGRFFTEWATSNDDNNHWQPKKNLFHGWCYGRLSESISFNPVSSPMGRVHCFSSILQMSKLRLRLNSPRKVKLLSWASDISQMTTGLEFFTTTHTASYWRKIVAIASSMYIYPKHLSANRTLQVLENKDAFQSLAGRELFRGT